jgi:streptogramin lyase
MLANIPFSPIVDGPRADARFNYTAGVAMDPSGNLYVSDYGNLAIRRISPEGMVTTLISGLPSGPWAIATGPSGNLYLTIGASICKLIPDGSLTTLAGSASQAGSADGPGSSALFSSPRGLAVDASENVYVVDSGNDTIRQVTPQGVVSTLAGSAGKAGYADGTGSAALFNQPQGIAVGPSGNLFVLDTGNRAIRTITLQGVVTTQVPWPLWIPLWSPVSLAAGFDGSLFLGGSNSIVKITPGGTGSTLAGTEGQFGLVDGPGSSAKFSNISGLAVDASGNVYAADYQNSVIRMVTPEAVVTTLAGRQTSPYFGPVNLGVDSFGNVFVPATNNTILKITPAGSVTTFAGIPNQSGSLDGPVLQALFGAAMSTAVDGTGIVYVADLSNATIRKITPDGQVTTLAGMAGQNGSQDGLGPQARFDGPLGITVDGQGNVYVTDGSSTIRKVTPDGNVTTLAGTPGQYGFKDGNGAAARFNNPDGIAVDLSGNIFVADCSNAAIRKITPAGEVTTLTFSLGFLGSAGAATAGPLLYYPTGITVDGNGNVYVEDWYGYNILQISPAGIASRVPCFNSIDTLNFRGTGIVLWGGNFYVASPWGVEMDSLY